jgi:hypothetical protein
MKKIKKESLKRYKKIFQQVKKILFKDWDPIGCDVPNDEYDSYVPAVIGLLLKYSSEKDIMKHLDEVGRKMMNTKVDSKNLKLVAIKLKKIDISEVLD